MALAEGRNEEVEDLKTRAISAASTELADSPGLADALIDDLNMLFIPDP